MKYDIFSYSSVGKRENNEDSLLVEMTDTGVLAVVADGVGGIDCGEVASGTAINCIRELCYKDFDVETLEDAIVDANSAVLNAGTGRTTIAVLWISGSSAVAANIGDSRIYQFRNGEVVFQSTDHSVPQLDVTAGLITPDQIRTHSARNRITRCLGMEGPVKMNRRILEIEPGDRFIVCSDGFWEPVLETYMIDAISRSITAKEWLDILRYIAAADESDNHTAAAVIAG